MVPQNKYDGVVDRPRGAQLPSPATTIAVDFGTKNDEKSVICLSCFDDLFFSSEKCDVQKDMEKSMDFEHC